MRIYVGNHGNYTKDGMCAIKRPTAASVETIECYNPMYGQYVTITTPLTDEIYLCEVEVHGKAIDNTVLPLMNNNPNC